MFTRLKNGGPTVTLLPWRQWYCVELDREKTKKGESTMRVGVFYFPTDYGIDIRELARAVEQRGFDSLLLPEHTHIPVDSEAPARSRVR